ncbi:MAG: hypothetical protein WCT18_03495 [Patescibacteria group bacterium]
MPVITIKCTREVFNRIDDDLLTNSIKKNLRKKVSKIKELAIDEKMVSVFFQIDETSGIEDFVVVEVLLTDKPERTLEVRNNVAEVVCSLVKEVFLRNPVEVFIFPFPMSNGFASKA